MGASNRNGRGTDHAEAYTKTREFLESGSSLTKGTGTEDSGCTHNGTANHYLGSWRMNAQKLTRSWSKVPDLAMLVLMALAIDFVV